MVVSVVCSTFETLPDASQHGGGGRDFSGVEAGAEVGRPCDLALHGRCERAFPGGREHDELGALVMRIGREPHQAVGKSAFAAAMKRQVAWATDLGTGLDARKIAAATAMLRSVRQRLESGTNNGDDHAD